MTSVAERAGAERAAQTSRNGRVLSAAAGAAFVVLILLGNSLAEEGDNKAVGVPLELLGYVALIGFVAYTATSLGFGRHLAATIAVIAGVTSIAVKLGSSGTYLAAEYGDLNADVAAGLTAANDAVFVVNWVPHGLFVLAVALAAVKSARLPPALGWTGVVIGAATMGSVVAYRGEDPFPLPFLLSLLWLVVTSVLLVRMELQADQQAAGHPERVG
jgi:hypothetical protein